MFVAEFGHTENRREIIVPPRKKQGRDRRPCFSVDFGMSVFGGWKSEQHKKADVVFSKLSTRPAALNQVEEPEAGRKIQTQMINLVIGVVPCPSRITHAASDRVGSCGTKLLNGFLKSPVAGRSTASLPVRAQFTTAPQLRQAPVSSAKGFATGNWFAPEKLAMQVIGLERGGS